MNTLAYRAFYKLFGHPFDPNRGALRTEVLCETEVQALRPAVFHPAHLDRIRDTSSYSSLEYELNRITLANVTHAPTVMYLVENATFRPEHICLPGLNYLRTNTSEETPPYAEIDEGVYNLNSFGMRYFGHWLRDDIASSLVCAENQAYIHTQNPNYLHGRDYAELLDFKPVHVKYGKVKKLWLLVDYSQNSHKVRRYLSLRKRIETKLRPADTKYPGVYLRRGASGMARNLSNEDKVIDRLLAAGFDVIDPETLRVEDILRRLWNAPLVIAVEGSAINHALYSMALDGALLVLQPPNRFGNMHKGVQEVIGRRYGFYVCQPGAAPADFLLDDFDVLFGLIDQLLAAG